MLRDNGAQTQTRKRSLLCYQASHPAMKRITVPTKVTFQIDRECTPSSHVRKCCLRDFQTDVMGLRHAGTRSKITQTERGVCTANEGPFFCCAATGTL